MKFSSVLVRGALACALLFVPFVAPAATRTGVSAVEMFNIADSLKKANRLADAEAIYKALAKDPDPDIRAEARFRLGMMLADEKRYRDAALAFRALLDEKPNAARVRLELARVLALMGDEGAARKELRQVQATGALPPQVALVVDQFAQALRSHKPWGGSFSLSLAPDTNINRATDAKTLDTIIAPLQLSRNAREQSGLGLHSGGQLFARLPLSPKVAIVPRVSGDGLLYRQSQFDDISGSAAIGLELNFNRTRLQPSIGATWRWYGKRLYARTQTGSLHWLQMAGKRGQFDTQVSVSRANYVLNNLQDGWLYDLEPGYERAFSARSGGSISFSLARQTARDPGYALAWGGANLLYWHDFGKTTLFGSVGYRHLEADARLFLFPERRKEDYYDARIGGTFRQLTTHGFAPMVRVTFERNVSTVGIYDYRRTAFEFGITRAF